MMENGWIKLHRKITEWEWYDDGNTFRMFVHLLLTANFDNTQCKGRTIKRGQKFTSIRRLAYELSIDEKTVQRCLHNLETTKEIKVEVTKYGSLITIRKYDDYQDIATSAVGTIPTQVPTGVPTPPPTEPPTPPPTDAPTQAPTINKNNKNNKNIRSSNVELSDDSSMSGCPAPPTPEPLNFEGIVSYFNEKTNGVFGIVRLPLSEKRKTLIRARIREHGKEAFGRVIRMAAESDFLKGQNKTGFIATFDWLIKPTNFEKVLSGNYKNHEAESQQTGRDMIGTEFTDD